MAISYMLQPSMNCLKRSYDVGRQAELRREQLGFDGDPVVCDSNR